MARNFEQRSSSHRAQGTHDKRDVFSISSFGLLRGENGVLSSVWHVCSLMAGPLSFVAAPTQTKSIGLVPAMGICFLCCLIVFRTGWKMTDCIVHWNIAKPGDLCHYEGFGFASFGKFGYAFVQMANIVMYTGQGAIYLILATQQVHSFVMFRWPEAALLPFWVMFSFVTPIVIGLCHIRDIVVFNRASPWRGFSCIVCVFFLVSQTIAAFTVTRKWDFAEAPGQGLPYRSLWPTVEGDALARAVGKSSVSLLAIFGSNYVFPNIAHEMSAPDDMKKVLAIALPIGFVVFGTVIVSTWLAYGSFAQTEVWVNMRRLPRNAMEATQSPRTWSGSSYGLAVIMFNVNYFFTVIATFPLIQVVLFRGLRQICPGVNRGSRGCLLSRVGLLSAQVVLALGTPNLSTLISVTCALGFPLQAILIPLICGDKILHRRRKLNTLPLLIFDLGLCIIALSIAIFGLWGSFEG